MTGMPPPPSAAAQSQMGGGPYYNPATALQNNNQQPTQQMNFQTSAIPSQQQVPSWQNQNSQVMGGYVDPNKQQTMQQPQRQPEPPKEKPPLPEEYIYLQTVLEELKTNCLNTANDPVNMICLN